MLLILLGKIDGNGKIEQPQINTDANG